MLKKMIVPAIAFCLLSACKTVQKDSYYSARLFYSTLEPYILTFDIDACSIGDFETKPSFPKGQKDLVEKLNTLIRKGEHIEFILLAFPFKSSNKDSFVDGHLPDMADYYALEYLQKIITDLKKTYPKVSLTIMTDGLLFSDLFEIPKDNVLQFEEKLKKLVSLFPDIHLVTFSKILQENNKTIQVFRSEGESYQLPNPVPLEKLELLKKRIKNEINHANHSFFHLFSKDQDPFISNLAMKLIKRDEYLKTFIKSYEKNNTIRLSIHYQKNISKKIGLKITPNSYIFPWNGVLAIDKNGNKKILPKKEIVSTPFIKSTQNVHGLPLNSYRWP